MMRVDLTRAARRGLAQIGDFIRRDNPKRATALVDDLIDRCEELAQMPRAFPLIPRYEHHGIRRRSYRGYLIFYRANADTVEILHIFYGARDYEALLLSGD